MVNQVLVESLDRAFENVCELDLIFHFDEVRLYLHLKPLAHLIRPGLGSSCPVRDHTGRSRARDQCQRDLGMRSVYSIPTTP